MNRIVGNMRYIREKIAPMVLSAIVATTTLTTGALVEGNSSATTQTLSGALTAPGVLQNRSADQNCMKRAYFLDVEREHKFFESITKIGCWGVSTGVRVTGGRVFEPKQPVTREAMAAFMYRVGTLENHLQGYPFSAPAESPFADVQPGDKFYREITWLHEKGITTGTLQKSGKPLFQPKDSISREALAAFLFRYDHVLWGKVDTSGIDTSPSVSPFTDLTTDARFYREITYLRDKNIATGFKTGTGREFRAKESVTREAMAAFISRLKPLESGLKR